MLEQRTGKGVFHFCAVGQLKCGETACHSELTTCNTHLLVAASTFCLTCVLKPPRSNKQRVGRVCVSIVFVSDELFAATRLQWGNWYTNDM